MDTGKVYFDSEGNERSIWQMVKREPTWAAVRIQEGEKAIDEITTLRQQLEQAQAESVQAAANKVCGELPEGWVINLCMENGAAWVEAIKPTGYTIEIDRADLSLVEQIGEAMRLATEAERAGGEQ